jgi:hypothetical protein
MTFGSLIRYRRRVLERLPTLVELRLRLWRLQSLLPQFLLPQFLFPQFLFPQFLSLLFLLPGKSTGTATRRYSARSLRLSRLSTLGRTKPIYR